MKKIIFLVIAMAVIGLNLAQAQFLKKMKDKLDLPFDKGQPTNIEQKENDASTEYSDATENNEKPVFVDKAPANGKLMVKLKKDDHFWGGYIQVKNPSKAAGTDPSVLDFTAARVGSFYTSGEMSDYAIYIDGQRILNKNLVIALRPGYIDATKNTAYMDTTQAVVQAPNVDMQAIMAQAQANGNKPMSKEEEQAMINKLFPPVQQGTYTFKYGDKKYGPLQGVGIGMFLSKSLMDGSASGKFYGLGASPFVGEKQAGYNAVIQTENKQIKINDFVLGGLYELTYPTGNMVVAQGKAMHFSNGKTIEIPATPLYKKTGSLMVETIYGTDSGHIVVIPHPIEGNTSKLATTAYIDYTIPLSFPIEVTKEHLLMASNPAKSVLYAHHTLYYPDGRKKTVQNVGDAQIVQFNHKDYIVWFEIVKQTDGDEVYVCQEELR